MKYLTENFPAIILRFFLTYGPNHDSKRFIPKIIKCCLSDKPFKFSAVVGVYLCGLLVVVFTYPKRINFSPLKNVKSIYFANTAIQLRNALVDENTNVSISHIEPFFGETGLC